MDMKRGYKLSEIGVIPDDWEVSTVGAEFEIKLGKMLDAEKNVGVPKPYIGNKAVQWDRIDISDLPTVPMSRSDTERFRLREGDLLVCEGGEVGRAAIWNSPLAECYFQKALHRLRPIRGFNPRVMAALLRQWSDRGLLTNYVTQTSIAHLPREKFVQVLLPVPPQSEQRAIATALSDVDALLGTLERLIVKKRDLKQAAMQQLLTGQTRLPGFTGEWEVKTIRDLGNIQTGPFGTLLKAAEYAGTDGVPLISVGEVGAGRFRITDHTPRVPNNVIWRLPQYVLRKGDIVFGRKGAVERSALVTDAEDGWFLGSDGIRLRPLEQCHPEYLAWQFQRYEVQVWLLQNAIGTTMASLNQGILNRVEIPYAPIEEQTAIASVLSDMDAELSAHEQRLAKTRALKQGMMQELLTGKTRLF